MVVGIIYIGHTTIYLARNVRPNFHIYSSSESDWYKGTDLEGGGRGDVGGVEE